MRIKTHKLINIIYTCVAKAVPNGPREWVRAWHVNMQNMNLNFKQIFLVTPLGVGKFNRQSCIYIFFCSLSKNGNVLGVVAIFVVVVVVIVVVVCVFCCGYGFILIWPSMWQTRAISVTRKCAQFNSFLQWVLFTHTLAWGGDAEAGMLYFCWVV